MSLQTRLTALAEAIGADIKAVGAALAAKVPLVGGVTLTGNLGFSSPYTLSYGNGALLGPRFLTGTISPFPGNWYRLCSIPASNSGYAFEFYFVIPGRHVLLKVSFGKTTKGTAYGSGILEVELLGSFAYGVAHPYLWRVVDGGTNGATYIDFKFPNGDGSQLDFQIHLLHTLKNSNDIAFPMNSMGSVNGTGVTNFGFSMGSGSGEGWTTQKFKLNAANGAYAAESTTFVRTTGTATAM